MSSTTPKPEETSSTFETHNRNESARKVFQDFMDFYKSFLSENTELFWKNNKYNDSHSHVEHIRSGVTTLIQFHKILPEDAPLADEEILRKAILAYSVHDYHKLSEDGGKWDISVSEVKEFLSGVDTSSLVETIDYEFLQSVMTAHHMGDETSRSESLHIDDEKLDVFYSVVLADGITGVKSVQSGHFSNIQGNLTTACRRMDIQIRTHEFSVENRETSMIINNAVSEILQDEFGWEPIRIYSDGVLYVTPAEETVGKLHMNDVVEKFRQKAAESHISYADDTQQSSSLSLQESNNRPIYSYSPMDLIFRDPDENIIGIIQKSIADSYKSEEITNGEKDKHLPRIQPYVDTEIHTETRRVTGIARGLETLYSYVFKHMYKERDELETVKEVMSLFEVDSDENLQEVEQLYENAEQEIVGRAWRYKYLLAQYIYEEYFTGHKNTVELKHEIGRQTLVKNLNETSEFVELKQEEMAKIKKELSAYIERNLSVEDVTITSDFDFDGDVDCDLCDGTTSNLFTLFEYSNELSIQVNGEETTLQSGYENCLMCQIEVELQDVLNNGFEKDAIYARFEPEFGYTPHSWWTLRSVESATMNPSGEESYLIDSIKDITTNECPEPVTDVMEWEMPRLQEHWVDITEAFSPQSWFGGRMIKICPSDSDNKFESITWALLTAVLSGTSVSLTKNPIVFGDVTTDNNLVSIDSSLADELTFYDETIDFDSAKDVAKDAVTISEITNDVEKSDACLFFEQVSNFSMFPASRMCRFSTIEPKSHEYVFESSIGRLNSEFGSVKTELVDEPTVDQVMMALEFMDIDANDAVDLIGELQTQSFDSVEDVIKFLPENETEVEHTRVRKNASRTFAKAYVELCEEMGNSRDKITPDLQDLTFSTLLLESCEE